MNFGAKLLVTVCSSSVLVLGVLGLPDSAQAGDDTTPPTLSLPLRATFVEGSAIGEMVASEPDGELGTTSDIQMVTHWTAADASGICGYRSRTEYGGDLGRWSSWSDQANIQIAQDDYTDQFGGGQFDLIGFDVQARDCAGNIRQDFVGFRPAVVQQDGHSFSGGFQATPSYSGTWGVSNCTCWSGGTTARTSEANSSVTFTDPYVQSAPPRHVALVMETAPDRGQADVLIDGERVATIDTYSAVKQHRTVVWVGRWPQGSDHTLTVVNKATPGRERIDVDAVLAS